MNDGGRPMYGYSHGPWTEVWFHSKVDMATDGRLNCMSMTYYLLVECKTMKMLGPYHDLYNALQLPV